MKIKYAYLVAVTFISVVLIFSAYKNCKWFPEKERTEFTIKIYYPSGRTVTKSFVLPASATISLVNNDHRSSLTSIWYCNSKPFGMEYGYLVLGVEDFEIISTKKVIQ